MFSNILYFHSCGVVRSNKNINSVLTDRNEIKFINRISSLVIWKIVFKCESCSFMAVKGTDDVSLEIYSLELTMRAYIFFVYLIDIFNRYI